MILKKKKICFGCNEEKYIYKSEGRNKYCQQCWFRISPPKKINPVSDKRKIQNKQYSIELVTFLLDRPYCEARIPGYCTGKSTQCHHKEGRENERLLNFDDCIAVCQGCHDFITEHTNEAIEMGLSNSKHKVKPDDQEGTDTAGRIE